jgi:hypothetical protein
MMNSDLDDWFNEEKLEYACELCEGVAKYRYMCGEPDTDNTCDYVCEDCLDMACCPACRIEEL